MNFNDLFNFDPEKAFEAIQRTKDAFNKAARADTGAAQPAFQDLNDKFNDLFDALETASADMQGGKPNPMKIIPQILPHFMSLRTAFNNVTQAAQNNPDAARVLRALNDEVQSAQKDAMPPALREAFDRFIGGKFGGGNGNNNNNDNDNNKGNNGGRKKPRGGGFDI